MSKRAEEASKEIYKDGIQLVGRRDRNNNIVINPETMVGVLRNAAQKGYEHAEKDLIDLAQLWVDSGDANVMSFEQFLKCHEAQSNK
jgi:hypothetical protein